MEKIQIQLDNFIKRYRIAIIGTLLAHAFFMFVLILIEITKPDINNDTDISVEIAQEDLTEILTVPDLNNLQSGENDNSEAKNIAANEADKNKSFNDYYREVENIVNNSKTSENFKANDYADKRFLAKDYSKEEGYIVNEEKPNNQNNTILNQNNSQNSYAGNTIITYNLGGRKASRLPVPAYQCLGSGEVNIELIVNQKGIVTSVTILTAKTTLNEDCLSEAARKAALSSKFAIDLKAPTSQKGTINYKFVSQ